MGARQSSLTGLRKDGAEVPLSISLSPIKTNAGDFVAAIVRDMTELNALNHQLRQAQKMEAMGQLTGGIAHDFNNLLGIIVGNLDLMTLRAGVSGESDVFVDRAIKAAQRGVALTRRLLAFARQQPLSIEPTNVDTRIQEMTTLLKGTLGETIEIRLKLDAGDTRCDIDAGQLDSVILNLCLNSRAAMPKGGMVVIETSVVDFDGGVLSDNGEMPPGRYCMIAVTDNGTGMPREVRERAFEPFFTTRETGDGTGLGLSIVYGFARQTGGIARIYSELGYGTTVKIFLPVSASVSSDDPKAVNGGVVVGHRERILVVEDNADGRQLLTDLLPTIGYEAILVGDGPSALKALADDKDIALVLTDIVLPGGINGFEVARAAIMRARPVPALLMSGFSSNAMRPADLPADLPMLSKPFRVAELAEAIAAELGKAAALREKIP